MPQALRSRQSLRGRTKSGVSTRWADSMALHEQSIGATDEWYTPARVFDALGCRFDMDVSAPDDRRFVCTPTSRWISVDSLEHDWEGFIWMNAPFGGRNALRPWLREFFAHRNGIALVPDRTSAPWWQQICSAG